MVLTESNAILLLTQLGAAEALIESADLSKQIRDIKTQGLDAVLDLIGDTTILDTVAAVKRGGRVCIAGFLGGGVAPNNLDPIFQLPSGVHLSSFASAFTFGKPEWPLSDVPMQIIVDRVVAGVYHAQPAHVFEFDDVAAAHRMMENNEANGKLVVRV